MGEGGLSRGYGDGERDGSGYCRSSGVGKIERVGGGLGVRACLGLARRTDCDVRAGRYGYGERRAVRGTGGVWGGTGTGRGCGEEWFACGGRTDNCRTENRAVRVLR